MEEKLSAAFAVCIAAGLAIPLLNVLTGALGAALHLDLDFDGDAGFDLPIPVNIMSLCFSAVVFGAVGRFCLPRVGAVLSLLIGLASAAAGCCAIGRFILRPLKRNKPLAQNIHSLLWQDGVVKLEIRKDFVGTITVLSSTGSKVTYSAKPAPWVENPIPAGQEVIIVEVDEEKQICMVCPMDNAKPPELGLGPTDKMK